MKVCILGDITQANFEYFLENAFIKFGWETKLIGTGDILKFPYNKKISKLFFGTTFIKRYYDYRYLNNLNEFAYKRILKEKPDLVVTHNNGKLSKKIIIKLRKELKCPVVCFAADDPTISLLLPNYLESLLGFSHIIAFDSSMLERIRPFSSTPVFNFAGASDPDIYFPLPQKKELKIDSELAYCSTSYQGTALGIYRGAILANLVDNDLKIYGDAKWSRIAYTFPELKPKIYARGFLSGDEMNLLYNSTKIYLGIVNPLLLCGVSQRIFDCAMAGCFQIVEWKKDIGKWFPNEEIETFKTIPELREKVKWYLENPAAREEKSLKAYNKVLKEYKWTDLVKQVLEVIN
jgi:spore maturation protein CgeB